MGSAPTTAVEMRACLHRPHSLAEMLFCTANECEIIIYYIIL